MLNAHARIAVPVESHFLTEFIYEYPTDRDLSEQEIVDICNFISAHERFEHWETTPAALEAAAQSAGSMNLAALIDLLYQLEISATEKPRWADKTPGYERHFEQLAKVFPTAKFIHIHRDGRDVSNSMCDRSWHGITEFQRANYWRKSIVGAFDSVATLGCERCLNVQYEQLVKTPESTLKRICDFIGEDFQPQMLQFTRNAEDNVVDQAIHSKLARLPDENKDLQRWRRESSKSRVLLFEALADDALQSCGYELSNGKATRKLAKLVYWLPGLIMSKTHEAYLSIPPQWRSGLRQNSLVKSLRRKLYDRNQKRAEARSA